MKSYVFSTNTDFDTQAGPLALGVGENAQLAQADAVARLAQRYAPARLRGDARLQALHQALSWGTAPVVHQVEGGYPTQHEMGHRYMSFASEAAATAFASDGDMYRLVKAEGLDTGSPAVLRRALRPLLSRFINTFVPRELIDWHEVQGEFVTAREQERAARRIPGATPALAVVPTPSGVAGGLAVLAEHEDVAGRRIDPDVLAILRQCTVEGERIMLPRAQLERGLYDRVNAVLVALGGRWVGRKVQAHVFAEDPSAALDVAIGTGTFVRPQDFGCFPTPMELVQQMMQRADIQPGMRVLEPSAGDGAIANAAAAAAGSRSLVTAVELLPGNVRKLHAAGFTDVLEKDFLTLEPQPSFDVVCMNPPFGKMADIDHVLHAARFLKPTGRLVAITSPSWTSNSARKAQSFKDFVSQAQGEVLDVAAGAFAAAGTNIATRLISMEAVNFPWNRLAAQEQDALGRPRMRACA